MGLIISELIGNSVTYAFNGKKPAKLSLSIHKKKGNKLSIEYCDNGPGYPPDFDPQNLQSLGLQIISMLCAQLNGIANFSSDNGAVFTATIEQENM
jgi:two-component sensor histidine kinase